MEILSIPEQITALFADLPAFAHLTGNLTLEDYSPKRYDFFQYPLGISWLGIPREQVSGPQEAFAALFLLDLHYQNDWIYSEAARTNADQFVIDRVPAGQWRQLLQNKWITDYFDLPRRQLRVIPVEPAAFLQKFLCWMPKSTSSEERAALESAIISTQWVYSLFPDAFYDMYFGQTDEHYFFAESGVYD